MINLKKIINLKNIELLFFFIAIILILFLSIKKGDNIFAIFTSIFGLIYTILLGKGKSIGYIFGIAGTLCGAYISFSISFFGFFALHLFYYFPMEIIGFFNWKNNTDKATNEVIKTLLSNKERIFLLLITCLISAVSSIFLHIAGDASPVLDSLTTVFALLGMYLSIKRTMEQWLVWTFVNFISVIMWFNAYIQGERIFSIFLTRSIYLVLGIFFFYKWFKDLKITNKNT